MSFVWDFKLRFRTQPDGSIEKVLGIVPRFICNCLFLSFHVLYSLMYIEKVVKPQCNNNYIILREPIESFHWCESHWNETNLRLMNLLILMFLYRCTDIYFRSCWLDWSLWFKWDIHCIQHRGVKSTLIIKISLQSNDFLQMHTW